MRFLKNGKYKILLALLVIALSVSCMSNTYAAVQDQDGNEMGELIKAIISVALNTVGTGVIAGTILPLINVCSALIFFVLYMVFIGTDLTTGLWFPFPDAIIFNKIPLLDPNFINPAPGSIGGIAQEVFQRMYSSFFILAGTIFTIAALIIGVKLVFSSLAAEKAQLKKSLNNWILGVVMLFIVHYLLAGMFYLNEQIVEAVSEIADGIQFEFEVEQILTGIFGSIGNFLGLAGGPIGSAIAGSVGATIGNIISTAVGGVTNLLGVPNVTDVTVSGFTGLLIMFLVKGLLGGDLIASLVILIILGETFALVISYVKRTFMCIFLGVLAPLIIAVDVVQKSIK